MDWFRRAVAALLGTPPAASDPSAELTRCEALVEASLALARCPLDSGPEPILRLTVRSAARLAAGGAALALVDRDGRIERYAAEGTDGCIRDTLARPDVLLPLLDAIRTLGGPVGFEDLDPGAARLLAALAPHGFLAVPLDGTGGLLVVIAAESGPRVDGDVSGPLGMLGTLAGATLERAQQVSAQRERRDELHRLAEHVLAARDEELRHTAHELHEGTCQRLAAANVQLQALEPLLAGNVGAAHARLRDARALVNQTIGELRELAQALRPSVLEDFGYLHALRWYLGRLRSRSGVALSLEVEGADGRLPQAMEGALYSATEDALKTLADGRHGPLRVRYRRDGAAVRIQIAGQAPEDVDLVAMRERLRPFGGAVHVTTEPDAPAVIEVQVPAPAVAN
jgi:signal transduction histidine kinase